MGVAYEIIQCDLEGNKIAYEQFRGQIDQRGYVAGQAEKCYLDKLKNLDIGESLRLVNLHDGTIIHEVLKEK